MTLSLEELLNELKVSVGSSDEILGLDLLAGLRHLPDDVLVVGGETSDAGKSAFGVFVALVDQ